MHGLQGLDVAGIDRLGGFGLLQRLSHVAGKIDVGRLPGVGLRVAVDKVAQFLDDAILQLAVALADIGQVNLAALVERHQQFFLGAINGGDFGRKADHILFHFSWPGY
ncbi:MAG TPA: hypothetical protein VFI31_03505 [Pirellulales bacterium]|nr:hypothetical protein [Pirellulales bacterium]